MTSEYEAMMELLSREADEHRQFSRRIASAHRAYMAGTMKKFRSEYLATVKEQLDDQDDDSTTDGPTGEGSGAVVGGGTVGKGGTDEATDTSVEDDRTIG